MEIMDRIPKKGEYFAYQAKNIRKFTIDEQSEYNDCYSYVLKDVYVDSELLDDTYLLFMYLGNGLARECSSSTIFNLLMLSDRNNKDLLVKVPGYLDYINKDYKTFYEGYKKAFKNPLLIRTSQYYKKKSIYKIDDELKELIQKKDYKKISQLIPMLESTAKLKLNAQYEQIIKNDHIKAIEEDKKLKKTLK